MAKTIIKSRKEGTAKLSAKKAEIPVVVKCLSCGNNYTKNKFLPVTLNCGHTFCRSCVDNLGKDQEFIRCSTCKVVTWNKNLPKNYQMLSILEQSSLTKDEPSCLPECMGPVRVLRSGRQIHVNAFKSPSQKILTPQMAINPSVKAAGTAKEQGEEALEDDADPQTFGPMRESFGTIKHNFDEIHRMIKNCPVDKTAAVIRKISLLYRDLDDVIHTTPIPIMLNRQVARLRARPPPNDEEDQRMREIVRQIASEYEGGARFADFIESFDEPLNSLKLRVSLIQFRRRMPHDLPDPMFERIMDALDEDHERENAENGDEAGEGFVLNGDVLANIVHVVMGDDDDDSGDEITMFPVSSDSSDEGSGE